jgi:hypothetical protein
MPKRTHACLTVLVVLAAAVAQAEGPVAPVDPLPDWRDDRARDNDGPLSDFRFISYFFTRASVTNMVGDPAGLKGVSLGPLGVSDGSSTVVGPGTGFYVEQRWIPVIEYTPFFFDGLATVRAQFEIDFRWGLAANTTQPNQGGGFNADQVNLQTKNINVAIYPFKKQKPLAIVIGTQSVYDAIQDPATTPLNEVMRGGYKLSYLGSDATGLSVYGVFGQHRVKASLLPLNAAKADPANSPALYITLLATADYAFSPFPGTSLGVSAWTLRDDTRGRAFTYEGLVYAGPGSTGLAGFTGAPRFLASPSNPGMSGGVTWLGFNFQHNLNFAHGPLSASGFVMGNIGHYDATEVGANPTTLDILGLGANLEVDYRYGLSPNDVLTLEGIYTTGDSNPGDGKYSGAFTMNTYGLPGAVWFNHRTLLLFPFTSTINNYTGAVTDISNQGYGVGAAILTGTYDLIPNTLSVKVGTAAGWASATPQDVFSSGTQGRFIGWEVNAEVKWTIRYLMTLGLHGGYMVRGNFYDGVTRVTANPYALFTTFTWYGF